MKKILKKTVLVALIICFSATFFACDNGLNADIVVYESDVASVNACLDGVKFRTDLPFTAVTKTVRKNGDYHFKLETGAFSAKSTDGHVLTIAVFDAKNNGSDYAETVFDMLYSAGNEYIRTVKIGGVTVDYRVLSTTAEGSLMMYDFYMAVITPAERIFVNDTLLTDGGIDVESVLSDLFSAF